MNDRALRKMVVGLGGPTQGVPREDGFNITVASEIMAVFCLATSLKDLKERLSNMLIGYTIMPAGFCQGSGIEGASDPYSKRSIQTEYCTNH